MGTITAGGIGSGLDVTGILDQIVAAERGPAESRLNLKEAKLQAELSAFGSIRSSVNTFQASLSKLKSATFFNSTNVNVSNPEVLSATTTSIAQAGNFSVEVKSLAQASSLASIAFTDIDDVIGSGTLTFDFGTTAAGFDGTAGTYSFTKNIERSSASVEIDNSNNTISGVRDAINQADIGVLATIVDNGSGFQLLLSSDQQGADNSLEIRVEEGGTAAENIDATGLSLLAFNSSVTSFSQTQTQAGIDAELTVNGLTVFRESNTVSGVINGVTLNLLKTDVGNPLQVNISNNNINEAQENISNFVTAYNELADTLGSLTEFQGADGQNGILLGDTTTRNILQQIRREFGSVIDNGSSFNGLSSIGIKTNQDGTLTLNGGDLSAALKLDFDSVAQLFYASGNPSTNEINFISNTASTADDIYRVSVSTLATQGQLTSQASAGLLIDSSNDTFSLVVDGISTGTITLAQTTYADQNSLAQEIENKVNAASSLLSAGVSTSVVYENGAFQINSSSYGDASNVSVLTENAFLGLTSNAVSSAGTNIVGSIGGGGTFGQGRELSGSGLVLEVTSNATGNVGSVAFTQGLASKLDSLLSQFLSTTGQLTSKTDSITDQIDDISVQRRDLNDRVTDIENRFRRQFTALDILLGTLQNTSNFLDQQLASLPTIGGNN
ncbi:Flagellar hook-associated protein FliD [hydrothermal vent metagenome]|uniref:Filament cap protein n=1 Tax=hydrothermal vent metagenome TaxID=652676 RepID=A0A3B0WT56_9ZZZZ